MLAATVGPVGAPGLPVEPFSLGTVLATVFDRGPLATYLSVAYVAFFATIGALLGVLGGYYGSGGYGDSEAAHRRAIALGQSYTKPGPCRSLRRRRWEFGRPRKRGGKVDATDISSQ